MECHVTIAIISVGEKVTDADNITVIYAYNANKKG